MGDPDPGKGHPRNGVLDRVELASCLAAPVSPLSSVWVGIRHYEPGFMGLRQDPALVLGSASLHKPQQHGFKWRV